MTKSPAQGEPAAHYLERGKPTLQLQKVLDVLDLMGLEVVVRRKGGNRHGE
ncbi:helix-turn-helix domain-containing protein [Halomonas salipaludis]|uniref:hypothetical protein n=1 Tax=Halomonas salipaludis TaxID=2032625 RepID=UPI001E3C3A1B|nr:hypothetical protein [Halomonas salipaludis]